MEGIAGENAIQFMLLVYLEKKPLGRVSRGKFMRGYGGIGGTREERSPLAGAPPRAPVAPGRKARSQTSPSLQTAHANPFPPRNLTLVRNGVG